MKQAETQKLLMARRDLMFQFFASRNRSPENDRAESMDLLMTCLKQLPDRALRYRAHWPRVQGQQQTQVRGLNLQTFFTTSLAKLLPAPNTSILFARWHGIQAIVCVDQKSHRVLERFWPGQLPNHIICDFDWAKFDTFLANYL